MSPMQRECLFCGATVPMPPPSAEEVAANPGARLVASENFFGVVLDICVSCQARQQAGDEMVPKMYRDLFGVTTHAELAESFCQAHERARRSTVLIAWQPCGCLALQRHGGGEDAHLLPTNLTTEEWLGLGDLSGYSWEQRLSASMDSVLEELCIQHGRVCKNGGREIGRRVGVFKGIVGADIGYPNEEHWDYENGVFRLSRYCWCDESDCEKNYPNFLHKSTGSGVQWYKHFGRSMEFEIKGDWPRIFNECVESIG